MNKTFLASLGLCLCLTGATTLAETPAKAPSPQQQRMKDCNQQASGKKGDERKAFMKTCLSGASAASATTLTPQERMKDCNKQATGKKGDERKAFMKTCLKG